MITGSNLKMMYVFTIINIIAEITIKIMNKIKIEDLINFIFKDK